MPRKLKSLEEKFWPKVNKDPNHPKGCWEWTGATTGAGKNHGVMGLGRRGAGSIRAHRFSYELHYGPIPEGLLVCHKCDNGICVNPEHLELGNHQKNIQDAIDRKRFVYPPLKRGANNGRAKLSWEQAQEIRLSNLSSRKLAKIYGVSHSSILNIKRGVGYKNEWREDKNEDTR